MLCHSVLLAAGHSPGGVKLLSSKQLLISVLASILQHKIQKPLMSADPQQLVALDQPAFEHLIVDHCDCQIVIKFEFNLFSQSETGPSGAEGRIAHQRMCRP